MTLIFDILRNHLIGYVATATTKISANPNSRPFYNFSNLSHIGLNLYGKAFLSITEPNDFAASRQSLMAYILRNQCCSCQLKVGFLTLPK